jgi:hypothetical protein
MRFNAGLWCDPYCRVGGEVDYFILERGTTDFVAANAIDLPLSIVVNQNVLINTIVAGNQIITQMNIPTQVALQSRLVADVRGSGSADLWGAEANARFNGLVFGPLDADVLAGVRHLSLEEDLELVGRFQINVANRPTLPPTVQGLITSGSILPPIPPPPVGLRTAAEIQTLDSVTTKNEIYVGQVGTKFDLYFGRVVVQGAFKIGAGGARQTVHIAGATAGVDAIVRQVQISPGGLLTPTFGIDEFSRTRYVVVPEWNIKLGYQVFHWLRGYIGYDVIGIYNVVRPGEQIGVSTTQAVVNLGGNSSTTTLAQPGFRWTDSDLWVQGFNFGFELRW